MLLVSHSTAASPCPWSRFRGPGAVHFDFQENSTLWGASSAVPWPAGLPRGGGLWLGGWCRLHMTFCQTLCVHLQPSSGPRAVLSWVCTLVSLFPWFCTPPAPQGSPFPLWPSRAQPCCGGGPGCDTPRDISAARGCSTSSGQQRVSASTRGVLLPRLFVTERPRALHPALCPAGHGAPGAASWGPCRSPFPGPRLPKSLKPSSF